MTRLLDLGVEPYLLRASLLAVISQRLVRLTCPHCREVEPVDAHVRDWLGVGADEVDHRGRGCNQCEGLGVHGRRAVYELLVVTPHVRELIVPGAEADAIHQAAVCSALLVVAWTRHDGSEQLPHQRVDLHDCGAIGQRRARGGVDVKCSQACRCKVPGFVRRVSRNPNAPFRRRHERRAFRHHCDRA